MRATLCRAALLLAAIAPLTVRAQDTAAFNRLDRRAREMHFMGSCLYQLRELSSEGRFGPVMTGRHADCVSADTFELAVRFHVDSVNRRALNVAAYDINAGKLFTGTLDTAALLARKWAWDDAMWRGRARYDAVGRPYTAWVVGTRGDPLSVWMIPNPSVAMRAIGGEVGYDYSPDGRSMTETTDHFDAFRAMPLAADGPVLIESAADELPLLTEMVRAITLSGAGRLSTIVTRRYTYTLPALQSPATKRHHQPFPAFIRVPRP